MRSAKSPAVRLVWITPEADALIARIARVSNEANERAPSAPLLAYMLRHGHWSPFEMVSMCVEIRTSRTIARHLLRHRSFCFQEFSQRYAQVVGQGFFTAARAQDKSNRQKSHTMEDSAAARAWREAQTRIYDIAVFEYRRALEDGVAREVARNLLPEGITPTRLYMSGTLRSWIHLCNTRTQDAGAQPEDEAIVRRIKALVKKHTPGLYGVLTEEGVWP